MMFAFSIITIIVLFFFCSFPSTSVNIAPFEIYNTIMIDPVTCQLDLSREGSIIE